MMFDIHTALLKNGYESVVCYGRGPTVNEPGVYRVSSEVYSRFNNLWSRITGLFYGGCFFSTEQVKNVIRKEKPDVVHLHCINGFFVNVYNLVSWLKRNKYHTVLTMHAELMYTANCGSSLGCRKWRTGCGNCPNLRTAVNSYLFDRTAESVRKMKRAFAGFEDNLKIVSCSPWLEKEAKKSLILPQFDHRTILNGIETESIFYYRKEAGEALRKKLAPSGEKIILHVTSGFLSPVKGGKYVLELAKRFKDDNVVFAVIGNQDKVPDIPSNIIDIGCVYDQNTLAEYYSCADIFLLTSYQEVFSMVCAESVSCGTPIVGFKARGPEILYTFDCCKFVDQGDIDRLEEELRSRVFSEPGISKEELSRIAGEKFSCKKMIEEYMKVYNEFSEDKKYIEKI